MLEFKKRCLKTDEGKYTVCAFHSILGVNQAGLYGNYINTLKVD